MEAAPPPCPCNAAIGLQKKPHLITFVIFFVANFTLETWNEIIVYTL